MVLIYTTYPSEEEAGKISKMILEKGLAGTVDLWRINSLDLSPEGKITSNQGVALLIKTLDSKVQEIENLIHEHNNHHPHPCIMVLSVSRVNHDYKEWLQQCIR